MLGFVIDIEKATQDNKFFRKVLYTAESSQLVVMRLLPGEDIGTEVHHLDQFLRIESGKGEAVLNGKHFPIQDGFAIVVPAGVEHNIINLSTDSEMKLYTVYSPPNHLDKTVHKTKAEAETDEMHDKFDGVTTES